MVHDEGTAIDRHLVSSLEKGLVVHDEDSANDRQIKVWWYMMKALLLIGI